MNAKKKVIFIYFLLFLLMGGSYAIISFLFQYFAGDMLLADAIKQSLLAGLFFGILSVAVMLIVKPVKIRKKD